MRFCSQQEQERPDMVQAFLHEPVPGDGEVRRGNIKELAGTLGQSLVERISQAMLLVVDDERSWHSSLTFNIMEQGRIQGVGSQRATRQGGHEALGSSPAVA